MKEWVIKYWLEAVFGVVVVGIGACYKRMQKKLKKQCADQKAMKGGTMALLRSDIITCYEKYMHKKWIPIYALENVLALYDAYHELGGNGAVTNLIEQLKELPNMEVTA